MMVYDGTWLILWYCLGRVTGTEYGMDYFVCFTGAMLRLARSLIGLEVTIDGLYTSEASTVGPYSLESCGQL